MIPATYPFTIYCGTTLDADALNFTYKVDGVPVDLTGCSVQMSCRNSRGELLFDWSTTNGKLVLDGANGRITGNITAVETSELNLLHLPVYSIENEMPVYMLGLWCLEITTVSGRVDRLLHGPAYVSKEYVYG